VKIGELASRCGVNVQTVRYYERRGLLPDPRGGGGGYREYDDADAERLRFVKEAQALGFTLREIVDLLALRAGPGTAGEVRERARGKLDRVRQRIAGLRTLERRLVKLIAGCSGSGPSTACSIMNRLEGATAVEPGTKRATRRRRTKEAE
jgi:DNA-binding transcriptional MerR regulator